MEEDILIYTPTVMFRGTPCIFNVRWNKKRSGDLGTLYTQGTLSMQCMRGTGEPFPGTWNQVPQVAVFTSANFKILENGKKVMLYNF